MKMYIKQIEIYGYGKWSKVKMDFHHQLQIFQGKNESGKSTLRSFIQHMLFGFPKKIAGKYLYEPINGGMMGGKIWLEETTEGSLVIERMIKNGKLCFRCETNLGKSLSEDKWKQMISSIDEKQYVQVFGFNKEQLDQFHFSSIEEMDQFLYSVSVTGSEEWMKLSTKLQKQADSIFTPKAVKRVINQQLQQLDLQMGKIEELAQNNDVYEEILQKSEKMKEEIQSLSQLIQKKQEAERKLQLLQSHWSSYEKWIELRNKIHFNQEDSWNPEWKYELERSRMDSEWNEQQLQQLQKDYYLWKEKHQNQQQLKADERWSQLLNISLMEEEIEEKILLRKKLKLEVEELQQNILKEEKMWNIHHEFLPIEIPEHELERLKEKIHHEKSLKFAEIELDSRINRLKEEQEKIKSYSEKQNSNHHRLNVNGLLMFSGVVFIFSSLMLFTNPLLKAIGGVIGLIVSLFSWIYGKKSVHTNQVKDYFSKRLEEISVELAEYTLQRTNNKEKLEEISQELVSWRNNYGYTDSKISVEQLCQGDVLKSLRYFVKQAQTKEESLRQMEKEFMQLQKNWQWVFELKKEAIPQTIELEWKLLKKIIQEVQNSYQTEMIQMNEGLKLQEQIHQLYHEKQVLEEQLVALLKTAKVQNMEEFYQKEVNYEANRLFIQQYTQIKQALEPYLEELKKLQNQEELEKKMKETHQSLVTLLQKNQILLEEQAKNLQQIQHLATDGTYHEQVIQFELWKAEVEEQLVEWASSLYASKWILESLQNQLPTQTDEVIKVAGHYFNRLTQGRYQAIQMKNMKIAVQNNEKQWLFTSELSRGTLDQLLVSLRLAFIGNLSSKVPLPVLIDDSFVNFDSERKQIMLQLIKEVSSKVQVIYFSLDDEPFTIAETKANVIRLQR